MKVGLTYNCGMNSPKSLLLEGSRPRPRTFVGLASNILVATLLIAACGANESSGSAAKRLLNQISSIADLGPGLYAEMDTSRGTIIVKLEYE